MTKYQIRQQLKNEALNKIIKVHSENFIIGYASYDDSPTVQRDDAIARIIKTLNAELEKL